MKALLILTLAAGLAAACSKSAPPAAETQKAPASTPPQPADAPAQPAGGQPAAAPTAQPTSAPPPASAPQTSAPSASTPAASAAAAPAPSATRPPAAPPEPVAAPAPKFRDITIPAGTALSVTVLSTLASNASKVEDPVKGALAKPVVISGSTALPEGAAMSGFVTDVKESGRVKGKASIAFRFDRVAAHGETHRVQTARVTVEAQQQKSDDVKKGGVGAGVGAIVGGVAGGGSGAAIGAVAGGAGAVLVTKGREVQIPPGTLVTVLMQEPLTVRVPLK
jgi:hypothetical protein